LKQIGLKDWTRLEGLLKEMAAHKVTVEAAIKKAQDLLDAACKEANETREEIRGVIEDWYNEADAYYDDRSEKWQEGDSGQAYDTWKDEIAQAQAEFETELSIDIPTDILGEFDTMCNITDNLPQAPEA
jgi:DNA phosphorothioation-dependent restriction protein DptG